ncbi:osmoprotectant transport system permease protein [Phycicoccus badiiscoriae]|uniref:Osmoprotectant transport system permease protein n=1 Tax=Pedococcus badiiscoriae TaxID=642776 RepID=A0A852WBU3_9MICO|nr:ABC transporter permease subunit [Pedococcus badiiscoriae]NYG06767.1 osmoprotectant transport system permease protein [Pedococcus badiiscoriae]
MTWFLDHLDVVWSRALQHSYLAGVPLVIGLLLALPLGWLARRYPRLYAPFTAGFGLLYTIPSLALFVILPVILGTRALDPINVVVAMTLYTVALLVRTVADALGSVPDHVQQAATAMGYTRVRRFFAIELPLAVPVISAGLRVAAVSNVSIVSVGTIIGVNQLGLFFSDGFDRDFYDPLFVGIVACVVLALLFDAVILLITRLATPWVRATGARA